MITPAYGLTATERVLPRMALDFTTASLDPRITFTRTGNTATVINSSGYIANINADLPRFDYDPVTLVCKGLLIEESRANICLQSNNFTTTWTNVTSTEQVVAAVSPDGTTNATKLITNAAATNGYLRQNITLVLTQSYTYSFFAKKGETNNVVLFFSDGVTGRQVEFNLNTGVVVGTPTAGLTASIVPFGNGWYRCVGTITASGVSGNVRIVQVVATANGTDGLFCYGAQVEAGAFPTSYIPTVASTVIRNDDVATMTSTNFSSWYTATAGAAVVWAIPQTATGTRPLIQFDDTTANEIIALRGNVANPEMSIIDGGAPQAQIDAGTIVANTAYKLSGAWNTDSCAAAQNGSAAVTDNTATIPTPTQLRIGSDGTNYASAIIQKVLYYPQRIIDAEVQAFSK